MPDGAIRILMTISDRCRHGPTASGEHLQIKLSLNSAVARNEPDANQSASIDDALLISSRVRTAPEVGQQLAKCSIHDYSKSD
jgi:hypothetical protein